MPRPRRYRDVRVSRLRRDREVGVSRPRGDRYIGVTVSRRDRDVPKRLETVSRPRRLRPRLQPCC